MQEKEMFLELVGKLVRVVYLDIDHHQFIKGQVLDVNDHFVKIQTHCNIHILRLDQIVKVKEEVAP